jgi:MazG family protein
MSDSYKAAAAEFEKFCETVSALRHPVSGCPWDLQQTHETLRRFMIEEAYEASAAMTDHPAALKDELGDVLLQVVLNAKLAEQSGTFSVIDVVKNIDDKMRRRHPHVFAGLKVENTAEVGKNWADIKAAEKAAEARKPISEVFAETERAYPALMQAFEIGKKASRVKFDWSQPEQVMEQLRSEMAELEEAVTQNGFASKQVRDEISDMFFTLVQLCRHLHHDAETVALDGNRKFTRRFGKMEKLAADQGREIKSLSQAELSELWKQVKVTEI